MSSSSEASPCLSVAIIARDAEEPLAETLVSIRNVADEIVLLDTGSRDETPDIARQLGARVYFRPWDDSFAAARNACLTHVSGNWVLWLDAGETISKDDAWLLAEFVRGHAAPQTAYMTYVGMPSLGDGAGEQVARLRLHPARPGLTYSGRVRESLDRSLFAFGVAADPLPIVIRRSRREYDAEYRAEKARRNLILADLQLAERGPSADVYNCLGEAYQTLGQPLEAGRHYQQALSLAGKGDPAKLEAYYGLLTSLEGVPAVAAGDDSPDARRSAQLALCTQALEEFPLDGQLLCAMGGYLQALGQGELAMRAYDLAYRHGQAEPRVWHLPDIREIAAVCRSVLLQLEGRDDEAMELLHEARQSYPDSLRLMRQLLEQHVQHARRDEALRIANQMPGADPARETLRAAIVGACAAAKGNWIAAAAYLRSAVEGGCRERFAWRWHCTTLMALNLQDQAEAALIQWEQWDSGNPELAQFRAALAAQPAAGEQADKAAALPPSMRIDPSQSPAPAGLAAEKTLSTWPRSGT
jgi:tetratricopeptide (TPR) repeat protein